MARMMKTAPVVDIALRERLRERAVMMDSMHGASIGNPWTPRIVALDRGETVTVSGFELRDVEGTTLEGKYRVDAEGVVTVAEIDRTF
jgi:hypothetical protein